MGQDLIKPSASDLKNSKEEVNFILSLHLPDVLISIIASYLGAGINFRYQRQYRHQSRNNDLHHPFSVAVHDEHVYISDTDNHRIHIFERLSTRWVRSLGRKGENVGEFQFPSGVAMARDHLYVADRGNGRIQAIKLPQCITITATARGLFDPVGLVATANVLYVADCKNQRICALNCKDRMTQIWDISLAPAYPWDLALSSDEQFLFITGPMHCVLVISLKRREVIRTIGLRQGPGPLEFDHPTGAVCSEGELFVADQWNDRIQVVTTEGEFLKQFGSRGTPSGQFDGLYGLVIHSGELYVVDRSNHRVQVFA